MIELGFIKGKKLNPKINDVTWLRRLCEIIDPKNVIQIGLRSGDWLELEFLKSSGIKYYTSKMVQDQFKKVKGEIRKFTKNSNFYISLDVDVFDPSIAPAVDHPEPNGLLFRQFQELINFMSGRLAGMDVCCLKPIKGNQVTEFTVVRSVFEILNKLNF